MWSIIFFILLILYLGLASVGHRFFIHQLYVSRLLKLFDYGKRKIRKIQQNIQQERKIQRKISRAMSVNANLDQLADLAAKAATMPDSDESDADSAFCEDFDSSDVPAAFAYNKALSMEMDKTKHKLDLSTVMSLTTMGIRAIIDDSVTKRFAAEELKTWNLLTRTDGIYHYKSLRLAVVWMAGLIVRYMILFPLRIAIALIGIWFLVTSTFLVGLIPFSWMKRLVYHYISVMSFRIISRSFSAVITYHDSLNKAKPGGICVANHTSPIDVILLHCNNAYALVGQRQPGVLGFIQRALNRATHHIWFDRFETNDRNYVSHRLREHAEDKSKLPILIFPEGTCVNNSAVMMFKKGSFEINAPIYPVAIKYDARFGDPFWNSSKYGYARYMLMMMTSWAIVCDVWFLPPMYRREDESAIEFANRVKSEIARKGGLIDLEWDGQLKRQRVKPEMVKRQQYKLSKALEVQDSR
ncbi:transferase [Dermatophagoides farinae]|uniref:Transferase n=1 Tax=Dermatophagoides farinae TaxID=6954 RepID=A0A922IAN9_DERFA|nr:transferase [Dermatophagoides farinae]